MRELGGRACPGLAAGSGSSRLRLPEPRSGSPPWRVTIPHAKAEGRADRGEPIGLAKTGARSMSTPATTWTEDRVETLSQLWRDGLSASQIARDLGHGITRNAVIGKVHRLGLTGRASPHTPGAGRPDQRRERRGRLPRRPAPNRSRPPPLAPTPELPLPETGLATMASVRRSQCRWPMGEPLADDFCLCGRPAVRGAYCAPHGAVAYQRTDRNHLIKLAGRAL
jgi:GcrA cell cycle regulator